MDGNVYVNLQPVINAVNDCRNEVIQVQREVNAVSYNLERVRQQTLQEIAEVRNQLAEMEKQARFRAAYQNALTEIIRVRQE